MATKHNISSQLMRPPRELASWNFPLSQILEEYFNLLPEPCKIHYGEAALIIQNSVNAYVRKVEELYDETKCLSQKVIFEPDTRDDTNLQKRKGKKNIIDFGQFDLLDFETELGKNINLKNQEEKTLKFLHQCFSQLENTQARLHLEVFDIQGEVIGKKYDFRCNQRMTKSGTLVEEIAPIDFEEAVIQMNTINSLLALKENISTNLQIAECFANESVFVDYNKNNTDNISNLVRANSIQDKMVNDCESSSFQESGGISNDTPDLFRIENSLSVAGSDHISSSFHQNDDHDINSCDSEDVYKSESFVSCEDRFTDISDTEGHDNENKSVEEITRINLNNDSPIISTSENFKKIDSYIDNNCKRKSHEIDFDKSSNTPDSSNKVLRRSKRIKQLQNDLNVTLDLISTPEKTELLEAIPFKEGVPEKLLKCRKEFRLPCHINLLKRNPKKRNNQRVKIKRSPQSVSIKEASVINEIPNLKMTMFSPSRSQDKSVAEGEQTSFDEIMDREFIDKPINYMPVTTTTMDLLGFHPNCAKDDPLVDIGEPSIEHSSSNASSVYCTPSSSPLLEHFITPLISEEINFDALSKKDVDKKKSISVSSDNDVGELVKNKIKKISEEFNLYHDEDHKVAKWHEEIKPRLKEAERKPPFCIHEYESKIMQRLETCHRKLHFDEIVREEPPCEIARYFSATLQLASTNNVNINTSEDVNKSIELILLD